MTKISLETLPSGTRPDEPVIFFGSGPVAAEALRLLAEEIPIEAVVTKPQPPHHRGSFPVIDIAQQRGLKLLYARNRRELDDLFAAKPVQARLGVLVDFGIIVSQAVLDYFPLGIINSHFSILPEWRGADPISFAILSGQSQTGVSIMQLVPALDEGPLFAYGEQDISATTTGPELTDDLINLSHALLMHVIPRLLAGQITAVPQGVTGRQLSYSRKLTKDDGQIDWSKPAAQLDREIRAFLDWPKSRTQLAGIDVIITTAHPNMTVWPAAKPGDIAVDRITGQIKVATGEGSLYLDQLKPAGKRDMTAKEFLAGYGQRLTADG